MSRDIPTLTVVMSIVYVLGSECRITIIVPPKTIMHTHNIMLQLWHFWCSPPCKKHHCSFYSIFTSMCVIESSIITLAYTNIHVPQDQGGTMMMYIYMYTV